MIPAHGRGPSAVVPLGYLLAAALAFVSAAVATPWLAPALAGHYYHPRVLALTHTVTLGWITLTIMGASYQIVPLVLERRVWSERLARWQLAAMLAGAIGIIGHLYIAQWSGLVWGAGLAALAAVAHAANLTLTLRGLRQWTFTARLLVVALAGFVLTAVFGAVLGLQHVRPFLPGDFAGRLHAHVHLAVLGWVLPMILGIAARVYPMFLLAPAPGRLVTGVQLIGLAAGVPAVVLGLLGAQALVPVGAVLVAAAVGAHLTWLLAMLRRRKRQGLDWALRTVLAGAAFLVPSAILGLALAADLVRGPRWAVAYGILVLGGWASLTIAGVMLKVVPLLVWYRAYSPRAGRGPVPLLAQLSSPAGEATAFVGLTAGTAALAVAAGLGWQLAIAAAGAMVAAGALAFALTLVRIVHHLLPYPMRAPATAP